MRLEVASESVRKQAFRKAYEFMEQHNVVLTKPEEYRKIMDDARKEYSKDPNDLLAMHLMVAVIECVTDVSKRMESYDTAGIAE